MKKLRLILILICSIVTSVAMSQTPFTAGNIVVLRVGSGGPALTLNAQPVFLDEYTPAGSLVQSRPLPTTVNGANKMFTLGSAFASNSETGMLTLSPNGQWLAAMGFNAVVGRLYDFITDESTAKTVALIDYNGNINTSTSLTDLGNGFPYSAVTTNGVDIWTTFTETGVRYAVSGATTSTSVSTSGPGNFRTIGIADNQLYSTIIFDGQMQSIGSGLPTSGPQTISPLPGQQSFPGQSQGFFVDLNAGIAGNDVLYMVNDGNGGIMKYSFNGSTWNFNGNIGTDADDYRGITGVVSGNTVTIYCTRKIGKTSAGGGELVVLTDASGYNATLTGTPSILVTAANRTDFRGVAMAPTGPSVKVSAKMFLQGAYNTSISMHKATSSNWALSLNNNALSQPYNTAAFGNYAGTESVSAGFFQSRVSTDDITDWVLVELRDAATPATVIARRAAFVREDGQVVDLDGLSDVTFNNVNSGNYYIVIRHRNHMGIRSATPVALGSGPATTYDFTTGQGQAYQNPAVLTNAAMKDFGSGVFGMWGGNSNGSPQSRSSGGLALNDYLYLTSTVLGGNISLILGPPSSAVVYNSADMNMDGVVRSSGGLVLNDYLFLTSTVLGGNISLIINQHL